MVINEKTGSMGKTDQEGQESETTVSGNKRIYGILRNPDRNYLWKIKQIPDVWIRCDMHTPFLLTQHSVPNPNLAKRVKGWRFIFSHKQKG